MLMKARRLEYKLIINGKVFVWNKNQILMCGQSEGEVLQNIYGDEVNNLNLEYNRLLNSVSSKKKLSKPGIVYEICNVKSNVIVDIENLSNKINLSIVSYNVHGLENKQFHQGFLNS